MNAPWTREEIAALRERLKAEIEQIEAGEPEIKPFPPMSKAETLEMLLNLGSIAGERLLTRAECSMFGQLLKCFEMTTKAEMLGREGRYFCFSESEIEHFAMEAGKPRLTGRRRL